MRNSNKKWCACWYSSSSTTLLLFMVPLVVISGLVCVLGPNTTSNWGFMSNNKYGGLPWLLNLNSTATGGSSSSSSDISISNNLILNNNSGSSSSIDNNNPVSPPSEGVLDLRSTMVVVDADREEAISDEYSVLNRSSSSSLATQAVPEVQLLNGSKQEDSFNVSINDSLIVVPIVNESHSPSTNARRQRLELIESHLIKARAAIKEAKFGNQTGDPDFIPVGPMYWNSKAFHRSYLEMERQFKIFVYEEGEPPIFHNGPCKSIYSMEGNFIHEIEMNSHFRTRDPDKAHVFFLPFSVTMMVRYVYVRDSHDFRPIRQTVIDYINVVSGKYPFWNRSLGADHFMLACHDWGPETSSSVLNLKKNSIRVLCNANTSEGFNPSKDVSFPEINLLTGGTNGLLGGPSASHRPVLAFFAGGLHGPIRPILLEHWENKDEDIKVQQYLPKGVSYYDMMRKSKYCICPSGYEVASPRVVEAIYTGCVPVLISDHYVPPFSDVLKWKSFSVEVAVKDIPNLKRILMDISPRQYIRMQRRVIQVRKHFVVNSPPQRFDVFHMILHSIWLRRLNVRVHDDQ
ncbi:hypothetical protein FEM48_Zijuj12G0051700 [Ziziphus jujuba var. spinosa]|uniref:Exostosin GT47 domain-containing protein n=1 Tax=Ziziphus jujuba var. spinosa TaxID=714518 RepID=A0A978UBC9_ZIZJJ|nr:hypothetical protein FEM48_Zijuj12G0051700 [Ziziphus jujuba var. spinosa]